MINIIGSLKETLRNEGQSILKQIEYLNGDFSKVIELISMTKGKLVVTGMGKSGIIGRKISATFSSTGTPSFFVHPAEAFHGDLGMVTEEDIVLALSNSGETDEILKIIPFFRAKKNSIISITRNSRSTLAINSDVHIELHIGKEACPLNLAPTTSTTVMLALGDALAIAVMQVKDFKAENYAMFHPGGSLGRRLLSKVENIMRTHDLPFVTPNSSLPDLINTMSRGKLGLALVNEGEKTIGIITDGDLRRLMELKGKEAFDLKAREIMTKNPKTIHPQTILNEAEELFNHYKINSLIVASEAGITLGVIQIYNL
jgi:arabinose-5-phosphate isomerase